MNASLTRLEPEDEEVIHQVPTQNSCRIYLGCEIYAEICVFIREFCAEITDMQASEYICRLRYQGNSKFDQRELSRLAGWRAIHMYRLIFSNNSPLLYACWITMAAGTLPATIVRSMISVAGSGERGGLFTLYSAHDNTIMVDQINLFSHPLTRATGDDGTSRSGLLLNRSVVL